MQIDLHIGAQKTGTTSIQKYLYDNRESLAAHGVLFPRSLGIHLSSNLAAAFQDDDQLDDLRKVRGLDSGEKIASYRRDLANTLAAEIAAHKPRRLIVSCEHFSARYRSREELARLYGFLAQFSDEIRVLIYLRRQDDLALSIYSTGVKSGRTEPFQLPSVGREPRYYHYEWMLGLWAQVFGERQLIVRVFDRRHSTGGGVVEDFVDAMDLPVAPSSTGYSENVAFTAQMIDFLRAFNVRVPRFTGNAENLDRGNIVAALSECDLPGDRLLFDTAQMSAFYERFRKGNDQVAARFFGRPNGLFAEADRAKPRLDAPASYSHEQLMDLIGQLWVFKHRELGQALCREAELKREVQDERTRAAQRQHELVELELVSRLTLLSELALERQQFEKSKAYALDVLALTDDPGRIHYLLANAFNGLGDRARAITHCEQAIALASDRPDYHRFREML